VDEDDDDPCDHEDALVVLMDDESQECHQKDHYHEAQLKMSLPHFTLRRLDPSWCLQQHTRSCKDTMDDEILQGRSLDSFRNAFDLKYYCTSGNYEHH
jgi:hypothetical protein